MVKSKRKKIEMFKTRLLSGIVLVALALFLIITGGNVLLGSLLVISLIGMFELYRIFHIEKSMADCRICCSNCILCRSFIGSYSGYDDACIRFSDRFDVCICTYLSKI